MDASLLLKIIAIIKGILIAFICFVYHEMRTKLSDAKSEVQKAEQYGQEAKGYLIKCQDICSSELKKHLNSLRHLEGLYSDIEAITYLIPQARPFSNEIKNQLTQIDNCIEKGKKDILCNISIYNIEYGNEEDVFRGMCYIENHGDKKHIPILHKRLSDNNLSMSLQCQLKNTISTLEKN